MSLKELLAQHKPRDTSGALSADRFEYQRNWALCRLLVLHQQAADYVMTFDYHEDVTILDSETNPQSLQGFQIKTKASGNWTIAALLKQPEGKEAPLLSIIAKLYDLDQKFAGHVKLLQVVSNAPLNAKLASGLKGQLETNIRFVELSDESRKLIVEGLQKELGMTSPPKLEDVFEFQVSDLSLQDHASHARGKLVDALQHLFPNRAFPISAVYRAILSEITARNNNRETYDDYQDFLQKKSLSRSRFSSILTICGISHKEPSWQSAEMGLLAGNVPFNIIRKLKNEWDNAILDRFRRRDAAHLRFLESVRHACSVVKDEPSVVDAMEKAVVEIRKSLPKEWVYSDLYIKASVLAHLYEY